MINYRKTTDKAITPTSGSSEAAGLDLYAVTERGVREIPPRTTAKIRTGIAMEIPKGYFGAVFARSGLATKDGLRPANCVGVIDSDYRGEIIVALYNDGNEVKCIHDGDRIAQIVFIPYLMDESRYLVEKKRLSNTCRATGGFGSTGV